MSACDESDLWLYGLDLDWIFCDYFDSTKQNRTLLRHTAILYVDWLEKANPDFFFLDNLWYARYVNSYRVPLTF